MKITYRKKTDLLYISLEDSPDQVGNNRVDDDPVEVAPRIRESIRKLGVRQDDSGDLQAEDRLR